MNKLSIITVIALSSLAFVSAEETNNVRPIQIKAPVIKQMIKNEGRDIQMPNLRTGDSAMDAQIKTLNDEMEAKIKAIRDEYVLKIKTIVGSRASTTASTTLRMMRGEKEGFDEGRKLGVPFIGGDSTSASGTLRTENDQNVSNVKAQGFMNFFRRFFGGNK